MCSPQPNSVDSEVPGCVPTWCWYDGSSEGTPQPERAVQRGDSLEQSLATFLLSYRVTPHTTTGISPSSLFFGRPLRTQLDLLKPDIGGRVRDCQAQQKDYHDQRNTSREFAVGQPVWVRNFRDGPHWTCGVVTNRLGPLTYLIQLPNGMLWHRHVNHLREGSCSDPSTPMESNDPPVTEDFLQCHPEWMETSWLKLRCLHVKTLHCHNPQVPHHQALHLTNNHVVTQHGTEGHLIVCMEHCNCKGRTVQLGGRRCGGFPYVSCMYECCTVYVCHVHWSQSLACDYV